MKLIVVKNVSGKNTIGTVIFFFPKIPECGGTPGTFDAE